MALLEIKNLNYSYKDGDSKRVIFDDAEAEFDNGLFYAILGESGSGKTTFLSVIAGQDNRYEGHVIFNGKEIKDIGLDKYRRTAVSMIYQNYNLINNYSAVENIVVAMDISENVKQLDRNRIMSVLNELGIDEKKASRKASSLSGGEQQRVAIARSILTDSPIIVADEPTGNLDSKNGKEVIEIFRKLAKEMNKCVIMVTHNDRLAEVVDIDLRIDQVTRKLQMQQKQTTTI